MNEKCQFCEHDHNPSKGKPDICVKCDRCSNFKAKTRMTIREKYRYDNLVKEEAWVNDDLDDFDRDTALAVLKAISKHMHPSHNIFGEPTLVINRYRFEAVRKKFLDRKKK